MTETPPLGAPVNPTAPPAPGPGQAQPTKMKLVTLQVPEHIPEASVASAVTLGLEIHMKVIGANQVLIIYPAATKTPDGKQAKVLGSYAAMVTNSDDLAMIIKTADRITKANITKAQAKAGSLVDQLTVNVLADREKKAAGTEGASGIIIPTGIKA